MEVSQSDGLKAEQERNASKQAKIKAKTTPPKVRAKRFHTESIYLPPGVSKEEEEEARIVFRKEDQPFVRIFPAERLKQADADFELAKVKYEIYALAEKNISVLRYIGPSNEELLKETQSSISDEDVEELDRLGQDQE